MREQRAAKRVALVAAVLGAGSMTAAALSGCTLTGSGEDLVAGKQAFVAKCGACHVLQRAGTKGVTGPDLDAAFARSLKDGFGRSTVKGIVHSWILHPARNAQLDGGKMPAKLYEGQDARNVAAYVAYATARKGEDTGALAAAVKAAGSGKPAVAKDGVLEIDADPNGQLAYVVTAASAAAGKLTIQSKNASATPHNIAIEGPGANAKGEIVSNGGTSKIEVTLKKGTYTFFCSVPGHRQAGMQGKLTVK